MFSQFVLLLIFEKEIMQIQFYGQLKIQPLNSVMSQVWQNVSLYLIQFSVTFNRNCKNICSLCSYANLDPCFYVINNRIEVPYRGIERLSGRGSAPRLLPLPLIPLYCQQTLQRVGCNQTHWPLSRSAVQSIL